MIEDKIIVKVVGNKKQKRATIPKYIKNINVGDYIEIIKITKVN